MANAGKLDIFTSTPQIRCKRHLPLNRSPAGRFLPLPNPPCAKSREKAPTSTSYSLARLVMRSRQSQPATLHRYVAGFRHFCGSRRWCWDCVCRDRAICRSSLIVFGHRHLGRAGIFGLFSRQWPPSGEPAQRAPPAGVDRRGWRRACDCAAAGLPVLSGASLP